MKSRNTNLEMEITASELRQQVEYSRTVCSDIFRLFSGDEPDLELLVTEYHAIRNRLSMMLDFLFQANLWCNNLDRVTGEILTMPESESFQRFSASRD